MTRLTDEQVAKLWAETEAPHIRTFADRIAALAVQEVERKLCDEERNANRWCGKAMVAEGKLTESQREVATLTAQLATAKRGVRDVAMSVALAVANDFLRVNHRYPPNWIGTENHANNAVEKHFPATPSAYGVTIDHDAPIDGAIDINAATAKREALVPCRECAGSGLVPATPSGELCDADCGCQAPEAREVPEDVRVYVERKQHYPQVQDVATGDWVRITPADAKRIVALAHPEGT
jgi:hypothetical protein